MRKLFPFLAERVGRMHPAPFEENISFLAERSENRDPHKVAQGAAQAQAQAAQRARGLLTRALSSRFRYPRCALSAQQAVAARAMLAGGCAMAVLET